MFFLFFGATLPGRISDNPPVINSLAPSVGKQREVCRQDEVLKDKRRFPRLNFHIHWKEAVEKCKSMIKKMCNPMILAIFLYFCIT